MSTELGVKPGEVGFRIWPENTLRFTCTCSKPHTFGEPGSIIHQPEALYHQGMKYIFIMCICGIWHLRRLPAITLDVQNAVIDGKTLFVR